MAGTDLPKFPVIIGPTASGKSALAMALARRFDGVVINMDSMQVYSDLRILSARPSTEDEQSVPHRLYGMLDASVVCSTAMWLKLATDEIDKTLAAGKLPIVCGGTGLYLKALAEGLAQVPAIPDLVRDEVRHRMAIEGSETMHAVLSQSDPIMAGKLFPGDSQRIARALEVVLATGKSLAEWQRAAPPVPPYQPVIITVVPQRDILYEGINERFDAMVEQGALDEVEALAARRLPPTVPAMKALGVPELIACLQGDLTKEAAVSQAATKSRRYAKRQMTWCRRQIISDFILNEKYSERIGLKIFSFIENACLTR